MTHLRPQYKIAPVASLIRRFLSSTRMQLVTIFWLAAVVGILCLLLTNTVGWDSNVYWKTIHDIQSGIDPYAAGINAAQESQNHGIHGAAENLPITYHYPPLTLQLLRFRSVFSGWLLALAYGSVVALGASLQLWGGYQMADQMERRLLIFILPALLFFPGLIVDDAILSGNIAYPFYGLIFAAAVPGWKHGRWLWFYLAVIAASIWKVPFLSMLAFPILIDRRQWRSSVITAISGVLIFLMQMFMWPNLFREYLVSLKMMFDWKREYGFSPAGVLAKELITRGISPSSAFMMTHLVFAGVLALVLWNLSVRVQNQELSMQDWVPVAMVGTLLLNPRLMKYDLAAIALPMLLLGWRALRIPATEFSVDRRMDNSYNEKELFGNYAVILIAIVCFLIANFLAIIRPSWFLVDAILLMATFTAGTWTFFRSRTRMQVNQTYRLIPNSHLWQQHPQQQEHSYTGKED